MKRFRTIVAWFRDRRLDRVAAKSSFLDDVELQREIQDEVMRREAEAKGTRWCRKCRRETWTLYVDDICPDCFFENEPPRTL